MLNPWQNILQTEMSSPTYSTYLNIEALKKNLIRTITNLFSLILRSLITAMQQIPTALKYKFRFDRFPN